jgi:hypothetical protein
VPRTPVYSVARQRRKQTASHLFGKLGASTRTQAVAEAMRRGLIQLRRRKLRAQ